MTFSSDAVREVFHGLPTQTQLDWALFEVSLSQSGKLLHIDYVGFSADSKLQIFIRVEEKLKSSLARAAIDNSL